MSSFHSNFDEVRLALATLGQAFHMRRRVSASRRLGDEILDLVTAVVEERTRVQKLAPDGTPLPALKPATIRRKLRKGFPPELGVETGMMLDKGEIAGQSHVLDDEVVMRYGLGEDTRDKAEWFQEGRPGIQAERPFYELGDDGERAIDAYIDEVAEQARKDFER